jgi:hypothetical protein
MTTLRIGQPRHLFGDEAMDEIDRVYGSDGPEISDACAVTVASWWAGPRRGDGLAFAELATSGTVDSDALSDDIANVYGAASVQDRKALDCLSTWRLDKTLQTES